MQSDIEKAKQIKILGVDDNERSLKLFVAILKGFGYDVITATNGKDCLKLAKQESPDLIFLDVMMPGLDGSETAQLLKEDERTKNIPIIFQTVLITENEESEYKGIIGENMFIAKPLNKEKIVRVINQVLKAD